MRACASGVATALGSSAESTHDEGGMKNLGKNHGDRPFDHSK